MTSTILMLGASDIQVPAIRQARRLGLRVITCDNRPDNPGHRLSAAAYDVSTTDVVGVMALARRIRPDGVLAFASDPAAVTAARVAEALDLPGDPVPAVLHAQDKVRLREAQRAAGLRVPAWAAPSSPMDAFEFLRASPDGAVIKPVDSSGNRGVAILTTTDDARTVSDALDRALQASRSRRAIIERRVVGARQFRVDLLVAEGRVVFASAGDQHRLAGTSVPLTIGVTVPSTVPEPIVSAAVEQLRRLIRTLGLRGGVYGGEFILEGGTEPVLVDFGARAGGNLLPAVHRRATGVDLTSAAIRIAMGMDPQPGTPSATAMRAGHLVIHSPSHGTFEAWRPSRELRHVLREAVLTTRRGDEVRPYATSGDRLGVCVVEASDLGPLLALYDDPERHLGVVLR